MDSQSTPGFPKGGRDGVVEEMTLMQKIHGLYKGTVEKVTKHRTVSAFKEKGVLSVDEFVLASDNLVSKCPTWTWESGDPGKRVDYLPADKQFLITRNVPCLRRASAVEEEYEAAGGEYLLDDKDEWVATHGNPKVMKKSEEEDLPSIETLEISKSQSIQTIPSYFGGEQEEDIPDMSEDHDLTHLIKEACATRHPIQSSGFISIDCGSNESYVDPTTTIEYKADRPYISTGETHTISPDAPAPPSRALQTLRSFPTGDRNCYDIDISSGGKGKKYIFLKISKKYLVRVVLFYGNYDGLDSPPEFDLYVGVDHWTTTVGRGEEKAYEMVMVARTETVSVCLVNTKKGTPYLSAIELRPLGDGGSSLYAAATEDTCLRLVERHNYAPLTEKKIRYPNDKHDRIWEPDPATTPPTLSTRSATTANSGYDPPSAVMGTASTGDLHHQWNNAFPNHPPILGFHVYLHFMEVTILNSNESRLIDIYFNDKVFRRGFQPKYMYADTVFNADPLPAVSNASYGLSRGVGSTLPPLLNAVEIYAAADWGITSSTFDQDVDAIQQIKRTYGIERNWMGDPCLPNAYSWSGLACSKDNLPRIISLNLSSSRLNGKISASFADLKLIERLYLKNTSYHNENKLISSCGQKMRINMEKGLTEVSGPSHQGEHMNCFGVGFSTSQTNSTDSNFKFDYSTSADDSTRKGEIRGRSFRLDNLEFTDVDVLQMTNNFEKEIGKGGFGTVYLGEKYDGTQVAVKRLKEMSQGSRMFLNEVYVWRKSKGLPIRYFQYNFYREGSDVYSFGVVLLQLITGKHVHVVEASDMTHITEWVEKKSEISDIVDPRLKGSFQKMSIEKAIDLAKKCTLSNSSSRPTMGHVLSELTAS
ncbi:putative LRR receptor-like serine/threonine-protein kinase [Acorus calamus]|uniref:LRR receptor-like serine/threonine-protein kinase n=1 Tax=Acorus calamus TaxID=4465 RepID=A0AAV9EHK5_ACOCL|nr:putative LRR receptor-like serine/threonine-protein kinase [Acorus calamus]